jgi:ADP-ribose pyrophosphatase YjhB (NUDIX family)
MNDLFTLGAFAVIRDDQGRVLLCHRRDRDAWNLPGGGVSSGELPTEAVVRETREETGLEIAVDQLTGVYGKPNSSDIVFVFLCRVIGGQLMPTDEVSESAYFDVHQFSSTTLFTHLDRIRDALSGANLPVIRRQEPSVATR